MKTHQLQSTDKYAVKDYQSEALLKELHILTRDGKMNQDSRRKLKQVFHLVQFISPLLENNTQTQHPISLIDFGSGKSYLGFILYDLVAKLQNRPCKIIGIELRQELVEYCQSLAKKLQFDNMAFYALSTSEAITSNDLPHKVDIVTALHACNTATDDAIQFALAKQVEHIILVPCCQAEVASLLKKKKGVDGQESYLAQLWRHPLHSREFGSHITNVLRTLQLESHGYEVKVTELVGWEHSMKNELIIASRKLNSKKQTIAKSHLTQLLQKLHLSELAHRFN